MSYKLYKCRHHVKGEMVHYLTRMKADNMKIEIIRLVIQLGVKSVVFTYDECQVQVIYKPFQHLLQMGRSDLFNIVSELLVVENGQVISIPITEIK